MNIYASPLRQRKIRSTFDFSSLLSSTSSLHSMSIKSQTSVEGPISDQRKFSFCKTTKTLTEESLKSLVVHSEEDENEVDEDLDENEDEYVKAIKKVSRQIKGRSARQLNAICSGIISTVFHSFIAKYLFRSFLWTIDMPGLFWWSWGKSIVLGEESVCVESLTILYFKYQWHSPGCLAYQLNC